MRRTTRTPQQLIADHADKTRALVVSNGEERYRRKGQTKFFGFVRVLRALRVFRDGQFCSIVFVPFLL